MCLVVVAFGRHPEFPLIVAGNRDEFHSRPASEAAWWPDQANILGGRDLLAGGTWLAVSRDGRFATVTNFRDADASDTGFESRGHLVTGFLNSDLSPLEYLETIDGRKFGGFNLLVANRTNLAYLSNRGVGPVELDHGIYGLSNAHLDAPWSKVERSKTRLEGLLQSASIRSTELMDLLADREKGPIIDVESGRLPFATAHAITAPFIVLPDYGTRCSTVVLGNRDGHWQLCERRFDAAGKLTGESRFSFDSVESLE